MRTVAFVNDNVPVEMIEAAGFRPQRLLVTPRDITPLVDHHVKAQLPFRLPRPPTTEAIIDAVLGGEFGDIKYLVVPRGNDPVTEIYADLAIAKRECVMPQMPESHFIDRNVWSSHEAREFNFRSIARFRACLEQWSGQSIDAGRLRETIARHNALRGTIRELTAKRASKDCRIAGSAALAAIAEGRGADIVESTSHAGLRIFLGGSDLHCRTPYLWLESCGANVVAEDNGLGQRLGEDPVDESVDPFFALAAWFDTRAGGSASQPIEQAVAASVERALNASVAAAIILIYRHDRLAAWEAPSLRAALEKAGIPTLLIGEAPADIAGCDRIVTQITDFIGRHS